MKKHPKNVTGGCKKCVKVTGLIYLVRAIRPLKKAGQGSNDTVRYGAIRTR